MKKISIILLVACGLAAGVFCGREARIRTDRFKEDTAKSDQTAIEPRKGYDLDSLLDWKSLDAAGGTEVVDQLKRLDSAAIWNLLLSLKNDELILQQRFVLFVREAAAELFRREGEGSLQWAAMQNYRPSQLLLIAAAEQSPETAKPWIDRYLKAMRRNGQMMLFSDAAIRGATARGVADIVRLKDIFGEEMWNGSGPIERVRGDFDFALFYTHFWSPKIGSGAVMAQWARKDPEAAWQMVKTLSVKNGNTVTSHLVNFLVGMSLGGNEKDAARWYAERSHELPMPQPGPYLGQVLGASQGMTQSATRWMEELKLGKDRLSLMEGVIAPFDNPAAAVEGLRALDSDKDRAWIMGHSLAQMSRGFVSLDFNEKLAHYYLRLLEELKLAAEENDRLEDQIRRRTGVE